MHQCDKQLSDLYLFFFIFVCWGKVAVDGASIGDIGIITGLFAGMQNQ